MISSALNSLVAGVNLDDGVATDAMTMIMDGTATSAQIAALLTALRIKGETVQEITAFARVMRARSIHVPTHRGPLVDTCGTGGDTCKTFNISTASAFVAAAAGVTVAKHGNRSVTSKCGSADVLEALGFRLDLTPEAVGECIDRVGIGFLFARNHHPAMKHAAGVRAELGIRTVFNALGPLTNPAGATRQVVGVYDGKLCPLLAQVLLNLGSEHVLVVHGEAGLDEIATFGPTIISEGKNGHVETYTLTAASLGLREASPTEVGAGTDAAENAALLLAVLDGSERGPRREIVLANAAAALYVAGLCDSLAEGVHIAGRQIDSGAARTKIDELRDVTIELAGGESVSTGTILDEILATKRTEVAALRRRVKIADLMARCADLPPTRGFKNHLTLETAGALIAEVKKASPSKGLIRADFDPVSIATAYEAGGASCLSVLTDETYFQGSLDFLSAIREAVSLPLLRKDFLIDTIQIYEARLAGADAILLIVAAIPSPARLSEMRIAAESLGLDALVEVHDRAELEIAIESGASLIGVNNRNLHTFEVRLETTEELLPHFPPNVVSVAESGISTRADATRLFRAGANALLVGESLMRRPDVAQATRELLGLS